MMDQNIFPYSDPYFLHKTTIPKYHLFRYGEKLHCLQMHQLEKVTYTILKPGEQKFLTENSQFGFFTAVLRFFEVSAGCFL